MVLLSDYQPVNLTFRQQRFH